MNALRMLFTFAGGRGHFIPLTPLARAAQEAGHVVAFGSQPALLPAVEAAGFTGFDTGGVTFRDDHVRAPLLKLDMDRELQAVRLGFAGRTARTRAAAIVDLAAAWKPDRIVCDEMDFGAMIAAERLGVPHASVQVTATGALTSKARVAEALDALRAEHGLPPDPELAMLSRRLVVSPFPPSLRDPEIPIPPTLRAFRPTGMATQETTPPDWLTPDPQRRATVYLTLGTVFNVESGDLFARLLAGLSALPIRLVVTTGPQIGPAELGAQPTHVRVERFIDQ